MYIHSLELYGFKAFADRTRLLFSDGINAVIGPNGSGKSNIFDAIKWCIGEQSPRQLRGAKMVDVLFHGSTQRPQSAYASVVITLANPKKSAPAPFTEIPEIAVERRLYRSGDTEYRINGSKVRLRDVRDFWLDCAVGDYTFIEQGRVADLIQARPAHVRGFIEEAAQIIKFRKRVEESRSKFKTAMLHLDVLEAALTEEEKTVGFLRRQARKAEQYKTISAQFGEAELKLWRARLARLLGNHAEVTEKLDKLDNESQGMTRNIAGIESELAADRTRITALRDQLNELRRNQAQIRDQLQRERTAADLADKETGRLATRQQVLEVQHKDIETEKTLATETLLDSEVAFAEKRTERDQLQKSYADAERTAIQLQEQADKLAQQERSYHAKLMAKTSELSDRSRLAKERLARRAELEAEHKHLSNLELEARNQLQQIREDCHRSEIDLREREASLLTCQEKRDQTRQQRERLSARSAELEHQLRGATARREELVAETQSLQSLLLLPDGETDPLYQQAASEGLISGTLADYVSADDTQIEQVERLLGLWLNARVVNPSGISRFLELATAQSASGQYVLCEGDLQTQVTALIATALHKGEEASLHLLADSGNVVQQVGGFRLLGASEATGALVLRRRVQNLKQSLVEQDLLIQKIQEQAAVARNEKTLAEKSLAETDLSWRQAEDNRQLSIEQYHALQKKEAVSQASLLQLEERLGQIRSSLAQEGGDAEDTTLIDQLAASQQELESEKNKVESQLESMRSKIRESRQQTTEAKSAFFLAADAYAELEKQRQVASQGVETATIRLTGIERELADIATRKQELQQEKQASSLSIEKSSIELTALSQRTDKIQGDADATEVSMIEQEQKLRSRLAHRSEYDSEKARLEERIQNLDEKISVLNTRTQEKYTQDLADYPLPDEDYDLLEKSYEGMETRLTRIGAVDPEVIQEYEELKAGFEAKLAQKQDLVASIEKLTQAISTLEEEADKRFQETYQTIEGHFRDVFPKLFPGGRAELRLEKTEEDQRPGVEIMAYPPGKKFTRIELLSGGEKSLTATAFVLSIFLCNPSPFCLLDELDAPLDDANLDLLGNVLRDMNQQSQVIIITHNKQTMQLADRLYGVTMQEPGVSSVFSVTPAHVH